MPHPLLRDGQVVSDDWNYVTEIDAAPAPNSILTLDHWLADKDKWLAAGRVGVVLLPAQKVEQLAPDIHRLALVACEFPSPSDGRGYTQGRMLRERYLFAGELRAAGYVRHDQLFFLARCGFNSFELPEHELPTALAAFSTFSAEYQPSSDLGLRARLKRRVPA